MVVARFSPDSFRVVCVRHTVAAALAGIAAIASCTLTAPFAFADETAIGPSPKGGPTVVDHLTIQGHQYIIVEGPSPPNFPCGALWRIDVTPIELVHEFAENECHPVDMVAISSVLGAPPDSFVVVTAGGNENFGRDVTFDADGNQISAVNFPNGATPVGGTSQAGPPPSGQTARAAITATIYTTSFSGGANGKGAIYQQTVTSTGILSAPKLIFSFTGGTVGGTPFPKAVLGPDGNLYGTTFGGGGTTGTLCQGSGCGIVYRLKPVVSGGITTWTEQVLYTFKGGADGGRPHATLSFDSAGNVYGTTEYGGKFSGVHACTGGFTPGTIFACGVVFKLTKKATVPWNETVLYRFNGGADGARPWGGVAFDAAGDIYGTTFAGGRIAAVACTGDAVRNGTPGCGTVFKLTKQATAPWPETVLYEFKGGKDGAQPSGVVTVNGAGTNITGTTLAGGNFAGKCSSTEDTIGTAKGCGVVFTVTTP